jgi:hypothetical protein
MINYYQKYIKYNSSENLNPSSNISYKEKYLKYKKKYFTLKNQLAGSEEGKFKYSINRPDEITEYHSGEMFDKIPEFESETKPEYKSDKLRKVNKVEMSQNENIIIFFRKGKQGKKNRELLPDEINEYIVKDDWPKYFLYVSRFFNSSEIYNKSNLDNGIIVKSSVLDEVFVDTFRESESYKNNIEHLEHDGNYNGTYRKGLGADNLLCTLEEVKKSKPELKVLYLHANGDEKLVAYYQKIGFTTLIESKIPQYDASNRQISIYDYIMFGMYDEVITNLKSKLKSNCDNKV